MKTVRTYKMKLVGSSQKFEEVSTSYLKAANWLSKIVFSRKIPGNPNQLAREFYSTTREKFNLPSQVTLSLFRQVVASYKTMKSNKQWNLAVYKKKSVPIVWKRDFNLSRKGLTIWGQKCSVKTRPLPDGKWGDSKLLKYKSKWYLCLIIKFKDPELKTMGTILGVDSGIKNLATAVSSNSNQTLFLSGKTLNHRRHQIRKVRSKVASVGTPSAKRLLKRLSQKEASVTQQELHVASKRLVTFAEKVDTKTIVFENLVGIRKASRTKGKKLRSMTHRWPYAMFFFFVSYKAKAKGIDVEYIDPKYTSQSCPFCGYVNKSNRKGLCFKCKSCNHQDNADRIGAINMSLRSILSRQAEMERAAVNQLIVAPPVATSLRARPVGH